MKGIEFGVRQPTSVIDSPWGWELQKLQEEIKKSESTSLEARWEYGKVLVRRRGDDKQLPHGALDALVARDGISRREVTYRMQFAAAISTKEELRTTVRTYPTWEQVRRHVLPKKPKAEADSQPALLFRRWTHRLTTLPPLTVADRRELVAFIEKASALLAVTKERSA